MLAECDCADEDVALLVRQKVVELEVDTTLPVMMGVLKEAVNQHALHILNMQGASSVALATLLFDLLSSSPGTEEDIVTLLTTVCSKLGAETPLTPAALKGVVQVIRDTNKEANRHSLHHSCIVLLSKLAAHFPSLVLDHVIAIFTFMGDSTMRMDDNYSIQVSGIGGITKHSSYRIPFLVQLIVIYFTQQAYVFTTPPL